MGSSSNRPVKKSNHTSDTQGIADMCDYTNSNPAFSIPYRQIVLDSPTAILILDSSRQVILKNPAYNNLFDDTCILDNLEPAIRTVFTREFNRVLAGKRERFTFRFRALTTDQAEAWFLATAVRLCDPPAPHSGVILYFHNLSILPGVDEFTDTIKRFHDLFDTTPQGVIYQNETGEIIKTNPAAEAILGLNARQLHKRTSHDPRWNSIYEDGSEFPGDKHPSMVALRSGKPVKNVVMGVFHPGEERHRWIMINSFPEFTAGSNHPCGVCTTFDDITALKRNESILQARLRLLEFSPHHTLDELLQATLDEACQLTGSPIGFYHFLLPDQRTLSLQTWSKRTEAEFCKAEGKHSHYDIDKAGVWVDCVHQRKPVIHNDYESLPHRKGLPPGHAQVLRECTIPVFREDRIVAILGVGNKPYPYIQDDVEILSLLADLAWDITEIKRAEEDRIQEHARFLSLFESISEPIYVADIDTYELLFINQKLRDRAGEFTEGSKCYRVLQGLDAPCEFCTNAIIASNHFEPYRWEFHNPHFGVDYEIIDRLIRWPDNRLVRLEIAFDITNLKTTENQLRHLSTHDALTGLYNRAFFETELARLQESRLFPVTILMADVNGLKMTNDTLGHAAGDDLLKRTARILVSAFRSEDVIARIGGDEFSVLLPQTDEASARRALQRLRQILQEQNQQSPQQPLSLAIGIATCAHGQSLFETLKIADHQMYRDKQNYKKSPVFQPVD